jgi:Protein kinase domain
MLLFAARERTLTGVEESRLRSHIETCETCRALADAPDDDGWRWLSRIRADGVDGELLGLPTVDPVVFGSSREIAAGGMGRILRAFDRRLGREVAVKEILDHAFADRFEREVRITARLQHPAIVSVYEAGSFPEGASFYTMPLLSGQTLQDLIDQAKTMPERLSLLPRFHAITDALAYAHARGVIHRDLKPSNVLVGEFGETTVIDWGLAKEADDVEPTLPERPSAPALTQVGSVIGTPCFMSPTQASGLPTDASDDVYALGAILYMVLAGTPPYWDITHDGNSIMAETVTGPPTPIAQLAPEAPADLLAIVERAMSRTKQERFATAVELADELSRFETGQLLRSREYTSRELFVRWLRKHRRGLVLAGLGAVALVVLAVMWLRYHRAAKELALEVHGERVTELYRDVARQAYRIDRDLLRLESALEGLDAAAAGALDGPEPTGELAKVYLDTDFAIPLNRPTDFTKQTKYRWPVSVEDPVVSVAPGVDREPLLPKIRRLVALRSYMRELVLEAKGYDISLMTEAKADALLQSRTSPIDYAYVDLPEGVHVVWPGMDNLRKDYDVRTASFYQMSDHKRGTHWGAPYVDSTTDRDGDDLVLPCTKAVWSATGEFLGVAGVEMTVTKMVNTSMAMTTRTTLRASLVNGHGQKVIDSGDANKRFVASGKDEAIRFTEFDLPAIAEEIRNGREGILETVRDGRPIQVAYVRLDAIGWYYVVEVDAETLGIAQ